MRSYLLVVEVGAVVAFVDITVVAFVDITVVLVVAVSRKDKITFTVIQ
jgi:hypothetical protein